MVTASQDIDLIPCLRETQERNERKKGPKNRFTGVGRVYLAVWDPSCVRPQVGENVYETLIVDEASYRNVFIHLTQLLRVLSVCILGLSKEDTYMHFFL